MSRAWLALRVLMGRHYSEVGDDAALALWDEALREWSRFAGWRGLHAHLRLGHVAALGSLTQVRRRRGSLAAEAETPGHGGDLHGAFCSVYHSLAKRSAGRIGGLFMARSLDYLDSGIAGAPPARLWGLLSTRGSVRAHLRAPGAVEDLARALEIADALDASDGTLAQLTVDLGWAEHGAGARRVGRRRFEDGLELMRRAGEAAGPGFRARSLRKAAFVRLRAGRIAAGARALMEADDVIRAFGAPDQEDRAIRVVRALRRRFGRWVE